MIHVNLLFFASLRDEMNLADCRLELADGKLDTLQQALATRFGDSAELLWADNVRLARNQTVVTSAELMAGFCLNDGDEVAFLPPVTGG